MIVFVHKMNSAHNCHELLQAFKLVIIHRSLTNKTLILQGNFHSERNFHTWEEFFLSSSISPSMYPSQSQFARETDQRQTLSSYSNKTSLAVQWVGILPMWGTQIPSLVWEDRTCLRAAKLVQHSYGACATRTLEARQWEARTPRQRRPHSLQGEKSLCAATKTQHRQK